MGLFKSPMPVAPGPRSSSRGSYAREGDTIGRLGEVSRVIDRIWAILSPYSAKTITSADGRKYTVLGRDMGITDGLYPNLSLALYLRTVASVLGVWVTPGTVGGLEATSDDAIYGDNIASSGSGDVWVELNYSDTDGSITTVVIDSGAAMPADSTGVAYYKIGHYEADGDTFLISQTAYGPVSVTICRNWYRTSAPFYGVTWG